MIKGRRGRAAVMIPATAGVLILLGFGTWLALSLQKRQEQTQEALQRTQAELEEKSKTLSQVEEERQRLASSVDALKGRLADTDQQLQQVKATAEHAQTELTSASAERSQLQQRLTETQDRHASLQREIEGIRQRMEEAAKQRLAFESRLQLAQSQSLSRAELEQLSAAVLQREGDMQMLQKRVNALSRAFEQLAWKHIELQEATGQGAPAGPSPLTQEPPLAPFGHDSALSSEQQRQAKREAQRLAARYRHMGEFCLAAYQYPQAAKAFERSLSYKDDPQVHATLAFLYGRLLLDPEKAALHAASAPPNKMTAEHAFEGISEASDMPRQSRSLVWRWLTKPK